jgi:CubicO group peptidase (beta-lactamase class C family)
VRHALTHTGGFVREAPGFDALKPQSDADLIKTAYAVPLAFKPGEKWEYSNLGYYVLAEIIHRAGQKPWPEYLREHLFAPLGMTATRTTTVEDLIPHRASGYNWVDDKYQNAEVMLGVRPSGAFISNVRDLAKWDAALYSNDVFAPQQRELLWTPVKLNDGSEKPYGFGWNVGNVGKHRQVHHAGTITGFRADMARFVDDRLTVIVLTNSAQALPENIALGVAAFYIPDLLPKRRGVKISAATLDSYVGTYQLSGGRVLRVARREDKLLLTMALGERSMDLGLLTAESKTRFFNEDDPRSTYVFVTDAQGALVVENESGKEVQRSPKVDPKR